MHIDGLFHSLSIEQKEKLKIKFYCFIIETPLIQNQRLIIVPRDQINKKDQF